MADLTFPFYLGPYKVVAELGSGGFATVYRAVVEGEMGFHRDVALKVLHGHITRSNPEVVKMLADEALLLARMQHPNIVYVQWFGQLEHPTEGRVFAMMMEYVPGRTLRQVQDHARREAGGLPTSVALDILLDVARGLKFAHELRVGGEHLELVHRDLKPDNVIISNEGAVKLLDFGIAKASQRLVDKTETNMIRGTVHYMSPEQVRGEDLDFRSDLFSFGGMLYESLVGRRMIGAKTLIAAMHEVAAFDLNRRTEDLSKVISEAVPVVERLLAPERADRYASTAELVTAMQRLRDIVPTSELASAFLSRQVTRIELGAAASEDETADLSNSMMAAAVAPPPKVLADGHSWDDGETIDPPPGAPGSSDRPGTTGSAPAATPSAETVAAVPGATRQMPGAPPAEQRPESRLGLLVLVFGAVVALAGLSSLLRAPEPVATRPEPEPTPPMEDVLEVAPPPDPVEEVEEPTPRIVAVPQPPRTDPTPAPEPATPEPPDPEPEPETPALVASGEPGRLQIGADSPFELAISHRRYSQLDAGRGIELPAGSYRVRIECIQCPDGVKPTREVSVEVKAGETTKELVFFKKEG